MSCSGSIIRAPAAPTSRRSTPPPTCRPPAGCWPATASATWSSGRSSARTTAAPDWPSGLCWAAACSTARARPSGASADALADVEPLRQAAGRVPDPPVREPLPPRVRAHLPVVAHPPHAEVELAAAVAVERAAQVRPALVGEDEHVRGPVQAPLAEVDVAGVEVPEIPGVGERRALGRVDGDRQRPARPGAFRGERAHLVRHLLDLLGGLGGDQQLPRVRAVER